MQLDSHLERERAVEYLTYYYEQEVSMLYLRLKRVNRRLWVLAGLLGVLLAVIAGLLARQVW